MEHLTTMKQQQQRPCCKATRRHTRRRERTPTTQRRGPHDSRRRSRLKTEMRDLGREYEREQEELAELAGAGSLVGARSQQEHTTQGHGMMFGRRVGSRDVEASVLPELSFGEEIHGK